MKWPDAGLFVGLNSREETCYRLENQNPLTWSYFKSISAPITTMTLSYFSAPGPSELSLVVCHLLFVPVECPSAPGSYILTNKHTCIQTHFHTELSSSYLRISQFKMFSFPFLPISLNCLQMFVFTHWIDWTESEAVFAHTQTGV